MYSSGDFDGIEEATVPSARTPFLTAGNWRLRVERLERIQSKQKRGVRYWLATFRVEEGPEGVGQERAWIVKLEDPAIYLREIKAFVIALLDDDAVSITSQLVEGLIGPEQPARGNVVLCTGEARVSQAGRDFTRLSWFPAESLGNR
jgi:hypothetical protein